MGKFVLTTYFLFGGDKSDGLARSRELYAERWAGLLPASCGAPISAITVSLVLSSWLLATYISKGSFCK